MDDATEYAGYRWARAAACSASSDHGKNVLSADFAMTSRDQAMKILILLLFAIGAQTVALAQGCVVFANIGPAGIVNAPVFDASGNRIIGPSPYAVQLFWNSDTNASMDTLIPYDFIASFSSITNYGGGYFTAGDWWFSDWQVVLQVRVWDTNYGSGYYGARDSGGEFGFSNLIPVFPDPPPGAGAWMYGLQSFQLQRLPHLSITPTPTNTLLFTWPTNITTYALQQNSDLNTANWTTFTNVPAVVGPQNEVIIPKPQQGILFRLISQ